MAELGFVRMTPGSTVQCAANYAMEPDSGSSASEASNSPATSLVLLGVVSFAEVVAINDKTGKIQWKEKPTDHLFACKTTQSYMNASRP